MLIQGLASTFGLTGGMASGKSTVARLFRELGAEIIDADRLGHELIQPSLPAYREIVERFGPGILAPNSEIDRKKLGATVFADPAKLQELNLILHPRIIARAEELARDCYAHDPDAIVIVDAALIFEAGIASRFRRIVVAWCRPEQQIERLVAKTGLSREDAEQRLAAQMPAEEKRRRADYLIDCSGSKENARLQAQLLYPELLRIARAPQ